MQTVRRNILLKNDSALFRLFLNKLIKDEIVRCIWSNKCNLCWYILQILVVKFLEFTNIVDAYFFIRVW
jgi:hypothetical protein